MITVDGDTSTNDMLVAMAGGLAGHDVLTPEHPDWDAFALGFHYVCQRWRRRSLVTERELPA